MSEFKFACPVCGQHITADAAASGSHLECPTCFQKIVVPQAPASPDSKFILSATQVGKPRPISTGTATDSRPIRRSLVASLVPLVVGLLLFALAAGAALLVVKKQLLKPAAPPVVAKTNPAAPQASAPRVSYPVPTNFTWSLNLANATVPETAPAGSIHGSGFRCERVVLQGGNLSFRQGKAWPPDLGLTIILFAQQAEELSGKTVEVAADRQPPLPRAILRWKTEDNRAEQQTFQSGYALKLSFGTIANGRIPGQIFMSLPDAEKSFLAGTFAAEIRKPNPTKAKPKASSAPQTSKP